MTYTLVNGLNLYYEVHGTGQPCRNLSVSYDYFINAGEPLKLYFTHPLLR